MSDQIQLATPQDGPTANHEAEYGSKALVACTVLGTTGFSSYLGLPFMLGAIADARGFNDAQIGWLGSVELLGLLLGSLIAAPLITRSNGRVVALVAIAIAIVGQMTTVLAGGFATMVCLRLAVGVGGGACYALALARLAVFHDPTRSFSLFGIGLTTFGALEVVALPWLANHWGLASMFIALSLGHLVAALLIMWLPRAVGVIAAQHDAGLVQSPTLRAAGLLALLATFIYSVGSTSFWAYVERLGTSAGLSAQFVGLAINVGTIAGIVTCLLTYRAERRFGQLPLQLISLTVAGLVFASWPLDASAWNFAIRSFLYYQLLVVSQILQQSVLAVTDPSGRQAALMPAAQGAGLALGPIVGAALLATGAGYRTKLVVEGATLVAAAIIYVAVYRMIARSVSRPTATDGA